MIPKITYISIAVDQNYTNVHGYVTVFRGDENTLHYPVSLASLIRCQRAQLILLARQGLSTYEPPLIKEWEAK